MSTPTIAALCNALAPTTLAAVYRDLHEDDAVPDEWRKTVLAILIANVGRATAERMNLVRS